MVKLWYESEIVYTFGFPCGSKTRPIAFILQLQRYIRRIFSAPYVLYGVLLLLSFKYDGSRTKERVLWNFDFVS